MIHEFMQLSYEEALRRQAEPHKFGLGRWMLFECTPTITLGTRACATDLRVPTQWLEKQAVAILKTDRGGKTTFHGEGQCVGFAVGSLEDHGFGSRDVRAFVEHTLSALARFANAELKRLKKVDSSEDRIAVAELRDPSRAGVWLKKNGAADMKLASVGFRFRRSGISHGFSIQIEPGTGFEWIHPCGMHGVQVQPLYPRSLDPNERLEVWNRLCHALEHD